MIAEQHDERAEQEVLNLYRNALSSWYTQMHAQFPEATFYAIGSGSTMARMRLGQWSASYTYENAKMNHIMAALSDDSFFKPPSDIDLIVPPETKQAAISVATQVFEQYRILLHIHTDKIRKDLPHLALSREVLEKGFPFKRK